MTENEEKLVGIKFAIDMYNAGASDVDITLNSIINILKLGEVEGV